MTRGAEHRLVIRGGIVLSMARGAPAQRADVTIEGTRIVAVTPAQPGPADAALPTDHGATVIDAAGCLVMPGLVNAHTHTPMTIMRGTMEGGGFPGPGTPPTMPPERDWRGRLTADDHAWSSRLAIAEMIRTGTTTFVDMYRDMDVVARAVVETGVRAALGWEITTFRRDPREWLPYDERNARQSFEACGRFARDWHGKGDGRVVALIAPHETSTCHEPWLSRAARLAAEMGLAVTIHVAESPREVELCRERHGVTPAELLARTGILERRVIGAHTVHVSDADLRLLGEARYTAVACLGCYVKLATELTPVPRLQAAGVNVALGTDGAPTNNNLNLWEEVHLNATLHGFMARDPTLLPGDAALRMATVGGAAALGLEAELGTVEPGKRADVIVVDLEQPHLLPHEGALTSNLTHSATGHEVRDVVVDGRVLMRDRRILTFDEAEARDRARGAVRRLRAAVGLPPRYERP